MPLFFFHVLNMCEHGGRAYVVPRVPRPCTRGERGGCLSFQFCYAISFPRA